MENLVQVPVETKSLITDPDHPGPEFQISSGLYDSDWHAFEVGGNKHLNCPTEQGVSYQDDVIRWTTGPKSLGKSRTPESK